MTSVNLTPDSADAVPLVEKAKTPRPLFIYGTLCAKPFLATILTGDRKNVEEIERLIRPGRLTGYQRFAVPGSEFPAAIKGGPSSSIAGYLVRCETASQRSKLDKFEGPDDYKMVPVLVTLEAKAGRRQDFDADIYVWANNTRKLSSDPWSLYTFKDENLEHLLDLFEFKVALGNGESTNTVRTPKAPRSLKAALVATIVFLIGGTATQNMTGGTQQIPPPEEEYQARPSSSLQDEEPREG